MLMDHPQQQRDQSALAIDGLTVAYGDKPAVCGVKAAFPIGAMSAIIGPNGAGKSTLLKAALGLVPTISGEVLFFGRELPAVRRRIAYVPQRASVDWDFPATVIDVVLMGLYAHVGPLRWFRTKDRAHAMDCLRQVGLDGFAGRQIGQLSGGQQQRVFIARALAQQADLMILDEPLAGVDTATERVIVALLKALAAQGRAVITVHHDLSTVAAYYEHVLILNVSLVAEGPTTTTFTQANLSRAYGGRIATDAGFGPNEPAET